MCVVFAKQPLAILDHIEDSATPWDQRCSNTSGAYYLGRHTVGFRFVVSSRAVGYLNSHVVLSGYF